MLKLVMVVFLYKPKRRYETDIIELVRVVLCKGLRDDMRLV